MADVVDRNSQGKEEPGGTSLFKNGDTSLTVEQNGAHKTKAQQEKKEEGEEATHKEVSNSKLLSYATTLEKVFIYVATFFAYVRSLFTPLVAIVFGQLISRFGEFQ